MLADGVGAVGLGQPVQMGQVGSHPFQGLDDRRARRGAAGRGHEAAGQLLSGGALHQAAEHDRGAAEMGHPFFFDQPPHLLAADCWQAHVAARRR